MGLGLGILGSIIGGMCGGPLGVLIGGGIGLMLGGKNTKNSASPEPDKEPACFPIESFFMCMGKLAKADGRVSEEEISFVTALMKKGKLSREARTEMENAFRMGRDSRKLFKTLASDFANELKRFNWEQEHREYIMATFCSLAAVDHLLSPEERENLLFLELKLETPGFVEKFFGPDDSKDDDSKQKKGNSRTGGGGRRSSSSSAKQKTKKDALAASYELLGIPPTATDQEVKKAWHKKAMESHPDFAQGRGLSQQSIDRAKQKMQEINAAYETICKHRNM